jgi:uncharacterized protein
MSDLLARLDAIARARGTGLDPAHDYLHVARVARTARVLAMAEKANLEIAVAAALLHELFNYPKGHPDSPRSGEVCAEHAAEVLRAEGCEAELVSAVAHAIRVHPFSRGLRPGTLEAAVLQDADRLDAIGAIGIARCFATGSVMGVPFYAEDDPFATARPPEDKRYSVDHFPAKLLKIAATLNTATARELAVQRVDAMERFLAQLRSELEG